MWFLWLSCCGKLNAINLGEAPAGAGAEPLPLDFAGNFPSFQAIADTCPVFAVVSVVLWFLVSRLFCFGLKSVKNALFCLCFGFFIYARGRQPGLVVGVPAIVATVVFCGSNSRRRLKSVSKL